MAYHPHDDDDDDDRDDPDPADMDSGGSADDEQDLLERCPECRRMVYADAERCPYCGAYVTTGGADGKPWWVVGVIVLLVLAFVLIALR